MQQTLKGLNSMHRQFVIFLTLLTLSGWGFDAAPASLQSRDVSRQTSQEHNSAQPDPHQPVNDGLMLTDQAHAAAIRPVLQADAPAYIRMFSKRLFRRDKMNLVLQQGKVFINYESPYEWETMPQIRIRPIDGNQQVPIRLRASFSSAWNSGHEPTFLVYLRLPAVLQPQLRIRQVLWGNRPATYNLAEDDAEPGHYILHIEGNESLKKSSPPDLFVQGLIKLDSYPGPFGDAFEPITGERADIARWSSLARPVPGRDYATSDELEIMEGLADRLLKDDSDPMAMIRSVADFLRERIKPFTNTMTRTPLQILTEKTGDEDDLCAIMAAFLRIRGIPCQVMARERYDFQSLHPGTWLEVYLPLRDGDGRWIIVDPLHVDRSEKDAPTLHRAREYIYSLSIIPTLLNYQGLVTSEILIGGEMAENSTEDELSSSADIHAAWDRFRAQTDQVTADFVNSGIQTRREFQFALGSAHLFVSRPVSGELPALQQMDDPDYIFNFDATPESVRSLWQVKIGPKDDLILEIGVTDEDYDLENMENRLLINRMEAVMREIGDKLLDGKTLLDLLEFSFYRDKYSDRLQKVSLRLSRVLVRNHAPQVIRILERNELLTASEGKKILRFVNITNGRNMYYMLEQARYVKRKIPAEEESPDDID